ncbi:hypothetical protein LCGC14_3149680 [marine sediment metagenome]|uniref:Uncharacterized protein n=1 Tax=marine sediment metagenome TaxID=412755 RepID=A0A0F8YIU2_9ZZZZ
MRTNIVIDDELKKKWWEIKREADHLKMRIGDYIIFCHDLRKKMDNKDKILKILETPLSDGLKNIDAIKASKSMWKS